MDNRLVGIVGWCVAAAASLGAGLSRADEWEAPKEREDYSPRRVHMLKVRPDTDKGPGHCLGQLWSIEKDKKTLVWSRPLINDTAPVQALVADSGDYVVTMDEWHEVGKLPLVIYGNDGRLIQVHNLDSLGLAGVRHIEVTVSSVWWSADAICFFGPKQEVLFIRLHWGQMLMVELSSGDVMDEAWYEIAKGWSMKPRDWRALHDFGKQRAAGRALELLASKKASDRKAGALAAGQLKCRKAIPRLRALLADGAMYRTKAGDGPWTQVFYVRKAAKQALEAMGETVRGIVVEQPDK